MTTEIQNNPLRALVHALIDFSGNSGNEEHITRLNDSFLTYLETTYPDSRLNSPYPLLGEVIRIEMVWRLRTSSWIKQLEPLLTERNTATVAEKLEEIVGKAWEAALPLQGLIESRMAQLGITPALLRDALLSPIIERSAHFPYLPLEYQAWEITTIISRGELRGELWEHAFSVFHQGPPPRALRSNRACAKEFGVSLKRVREERNRVFSYVHNSLMADGYTS